MKRQISSEHTTAIQIVWALACIILPLLALIFFVEPFLKSKLLLLFIAVLSWSFSFTCLSFLVKLYGVAFDNEYVYLSRLQKNKKISFENIIAIKAMIIPFRIFYKNSYLITLIYLDGNVNNKIYFLSKGSTGIVGTVNNIPWIDTFREFIKDKKYYS